MLPRLNLGVGNEVSVVVGPRDLVVVARRKVIIAGLCSASKMVGVPEPVLCAVSSTGTRVAIPQVEDALEGIVSRRALCGRASDVSKVSMVPWSNRGCTEVRGLVLRRLRDRERVPPEWVLRFRSCVLTVDAVR